ncbi:hypothetical protein SRABI98_00658 [Microbacterium sp. Bi98]|uniref:ankyrin repeat domain-containing protein n=2 Tax=unclassified Microbacterium TaxID=2609290 RepID=UPI0006F5429E|nr:ankyrin repeat domain-containing protein [Microbacterium sp. Bi98]KRD50521.1 hypothetical protein ASE34_13290 [Microbacterium sp. Root280D1]CAH0145715.1 hypothetical protein SRABI98_00658 [Microbacterium sp. Bi98]
MPSAHGLAKMGSYEDFVALYDGDAHVVSSSGLTLLHRALGNRHLDARLAISSRLLDDGADAGAVVAPEGYSTLHILFSQTSHDFVAEVPLVERLLEGGADVNANAARWGTPLQTLAVALKYSDEELAPFYEVLFARDDLDLLAPGRDGLSTLETSRRLDDHRTDLSSRMEQYL